MARDLSNFSNHYDSLLMDDYGQEPDRGHIHMLKEVIQNWITNMPDCKSVLDVGCGASAMAEPFFKVLNIEYTGIALGMDSFKAKQRGKNVLNMDMTFMEFEDEKFDLVLARHVTEHSPMPLLTLMEFYRVSKAWLCLIVPNPGFYGETGLQHYSVLTSEQWLFLCKRAGWFPIWTDMTNPTEFRFMMEKRKKDYMKKEQ